MESNENAYRSALPQPSRLHSPKIKGGLTELSASANNVRQTTMPPPPVPGALKRKPALERGDEHPRAAPAPPSSRPINGVKASSLAGLNRQKQYASSVSSRPTSSASHHRNNSHNSFSNSMGVGRTAANSSHRPHSSMSSHNYGKSIPTPARPASSFDGPLKNSRNVQRDGALNSRRQFSFHERSFSGESAPSDLSIESDDSSFPNQKINNGEWPNLPKGVASRRRPSKNQRDTSISTAMQALSLDPKRPPSSQSSVAVARDFPFSPQTPSLIPKKSFVSLNPENTSPSKSCRKTPKAVTPFLNKSSNTRLAEWDLGTRLEGIESMYTELKATVNSSTAESNSLKESITLYKTRISELEDMRAQAASTTASLQREVDSLKGELSTASIALGTAKQKRTLELSMSTQALEEVKRVHGNELEDIQRRNRRDLDELGREAEEDIRKLDRAHRDEISDLRRKLEEALEQEKDQRRREIQELSAEGTISRQKVELELEAKDKALCGLRNEVELARADISRERDVTRDLKGKLSDAATNSMALETAMQSLRARITFLESDCKSQSQAFEDLERRTRNAIRESEEAKAKLRAEETLRRKLHNQVQELKGNIRVFCRVRPVLDTEVAEQARIAFPDSGVDAKEVEVSGPDEKSSLGTVTTKRNAFSFDRVFVPNSHNSEVFNELSQLVQSALDGYNVCIFCYGQTGSGKTYTMSSEDGMIPRAVNQIYETAQLLEEKGWRYSMEGSFVEVYNENINDLLGKPEEFDKKKHEIRHDMQKCKTSITDITTVNLDSPGKVESILRRAMNNRSVAATKANERSSRSHSVFILKLIGENSITGERSEGTLNLVDLAGSERLSHSGATGERLKETQNINKSLSCLGDVIGALGQGKEGGHIPYRNSKLTYLLQFSLGGNSKTLMFVMISPLQAHLSETVTSLKFATKVHNTHIGTAKRQAKTRD